MGTMGMTDASRGRRFTERGPVITFAIGQGVCNIAGMPKPRAPAAQKIAVNNTVKLSAGLQQRVVAAMQLEGFTVWSEFCRVALTEKCQHTEQRLLARDLGEFQRVSPLPAPPAPAVRKY